MPVVPYFQSLFVASSNDHQGVTFLNHLQDEDPKLLSDSGGDFADIHPCSDLHQPAREVPSQPGWHFGEHDDDQKSSLA